MIRLPAAAALILALTVSANAETRYDRKLEDAVKTIVAAKIGDIRGSFDVGHDAKFVIPDQASTASTIIQTTSSAAGNDASSIVAPAPKPKLSSIVAF